jgi:hypothetical protein
MQKMKNKTAKPATAAAAPATAIPAIVPVLNEAFCALEAVAVELELAVSGFASIVLENAGGVDVENVEVPRVEVDAGAGAVVTSGGVPVTVAKVDSKGVVEGWVIVGGSVDELAANVAVIVARVSGTEFMTPAHILYTNPSELVEEQFEITQRRPASPNAKPDGFGVTQRNSREEVFAQLASLYSV